MYSKYLAMAMGLAMMSGGERHTYVDDIKPRSKEDRDNDYKNLIESRKAKRKDKKVKTPAQIAYAQRNYERRQKK